MNVGDRGRCQQCGGKIVLVHDFRTLNLDLGVWVHEGAFRRNFGGHPAVGPTS